MDLRKVQEIGGGTALVSLPKEWVKRNNIRKGTVLALEQSPSGYLIVYPFTGEEKKIREAYIKYPAKHKLQMVNSITGAYLLGYDVVRMAGEKRITLEDREIVKNAIRQLVGLEIVEEDARSITAQFLLEPSTLQPEKIFRRMHMIAREMYRDALTSLVEKDRHLVKIILVRDDEVDRLYFLLVRLIRTATLDLKLAAKYHLDPIDCLDYRVASHILESIGDASVEIAQNVLELPEELLTDSNAESVITRMVNVIQMMQDTAVKSFLSKSSEEARKVLVAYETFEREMKKFEAFALPQSTDNSLHLRTILSATEKICRYTIDIADLAVPLYPIVK